MLVLLNHLDVNRDLLFLLCVCLHSLFPWFVHSLVYSLVLFSLLQLWKTGGQCLVGRCARLRAQLLDAICLRDTNRGDGWTRLTIAMKATKGRVEWRVCKGRGSCKHFIFLIICFIQSCACVCSCICACVCVCLCVCSLSRSCPFDLFCLLGTGLLPEFVIGRSWIQDLG